MQQKYLWGGAALVVAGAAAAYVGTDYAYRHPETVLGRAATGLISFGLRTNPMVAANSATSGTEAAATEVAEVQIVKPVLAPDESTIEPIQVEIVPPPTQEPPTGATEESDWTWPLFQGWERCRETDDEDDLVLPMPYAQPLPEGDCDSSHMLNAIGISSEMMPEIDIDFQMALGIINKFEPNGIWNGLTPEGTFTPDIDQAVEVPDANWLPSPIQSAWNMAVSFAKWWAFVPKQYRFDDGAEACEMGRPLNIVKKYMLLFGAAEESECPVEEMPVVPETENGEEQSEESARQAQESSHYHHYHQGCPYMGGCYCPPQSPVYVPEAREVVLPSWVKPTPAAKPYKLKKHAHADKAGFMERLLNHFSERRQATTPFTDTMEFRPSDAGNYPMSMINPF
jgi:hypothetical protein